jgi:hypothetical protein
MAALPVTSRNWETCGDGFSPSEHWVRSNPALAHWDEPSSGRAPAEATAAIENYNQVRTQRVKKDKVTQLRSTLANPAGLTPEP